MYSVEFSPNLEQFQMRGTVSGVFLVRMDSSIQVWHIVEVMLRDFKQHHITQIPVTERTKLERIANDAGSGWACGNELPLQS